MCGPEAPPAQANTRSPNLPTKSHLELVSVVNSRCGIRSGAACCSILQCEIKSRPRRENNHSTRGLSQRCLPSCEEDSLVHTVWRLAARDNYGGEGESVTPHLTTSLQENQHSARRPGKHKRKRRLTVKQLQVIHENRHAESQLYNLTLDANDLKQQVRDFLAHKSIHETRALVARQCFNAGVLRTTEQFFRVFRTGFREWELREAAFLAATLDQDVALGSIAHGTTIFFDQWRRYKKILQQRSFSISSIRILVSDSESCVVECKGEFEGRLTLAAIAAVFPHILEDTELLSKVVNCRLVCPTRTLIYFDESGRIVQYDAHADMFAGLNRILVSNPMDVIMFMVNARISSEGSMIPNVRDYGVVDVDIKYGRSRVGQGAPVEIEEEEEDRGMVASEDLLSPSSFPGSDRSNDSDRSSIEYILSL